MAGVPLGTLKVVARGTQVTVQSWSTAFWVALDVGSAPTADTMAAIATAIEVPVFSAVVSIAGGIWSTETKYVETAVYYYPPDSVAAEYSSTASSAVEPGTETDYAPTFQSIVASLRTPFEGKSYRGRMYWPYSGGGVASNGEYLSSACTLVADQTADMMTAVNALNLTADGITGQTCVVASFTKHFTTPITKVIVDSIPDVQRRRKDKLGAAYTEFQAVT